MQYRNRPSLGHHALPERGQRISGIPRTTANTVKAPSCSSPKRTSSVDAVSPRLRSSCDVAAIHVVSYRMCWTDLNEVALLKRHENSIARHASFKSDLSPSLGSLSPHRRVSTLESSTARKQRDYAARGQNAIPKSQEGSSLLVQKSWFSRFGLTDHDDDR